MTVDDDCSVINDDRYNDYPRRLQRISGLPKEFLSREILPLRDIPHTEDPRRKRSLQKVLDLERDRANLPLVLLDRQPVVDEGSGVRLLDKQEYKRRLRRAVIPPARTRPEIRPLWMPNVRDPRRVRACERDGHEIWDMGTVTVVKNVLLPDEDETCPVLVIDFTDWPHAVSSEVEIWPHECNRERARLDAQFLDDSLMIEDNVDREDIIELDENGQPVQHYHADVDTPMLGDDDDEILIDGVFNPQEQPRERRFSDSDNPVIRVKEEPVLRRPMPTECEENVDLVDLCSDDELDVKPKLEPVREGYREDVVREILEVVTLDDDDDIEIERVRPTHPLDRSSKPKNNSAREQDNNCLVQSEILISQPRLEADEADSNRNTTPASHVRGGDATVDAASEIQDETSTARASRSAVRSPPSRNPCEIDAVAAISERADLRSACRELVPAYVCDYGHRSVSELSAPRRSSSSSLDNDDADKRKSAMDRAAREENELSVPFPSPVNKNSSECITLALDASFLRGLHVRFDEGATLKKQWTGRSPEAAVWTGCEVVRRERRASEVARRWRPYEGRMGRPPAKRQLEFERAAELLHECFGVSLDWSNISIFIDSHNLTLRCLLQAHVRATRSVNFWRARNDHWKNKNECSTKDVPQIENCDSSDNNNQRSVCLYDADDEINDSKELIVQEIQHEELYFSDSPKIPLKLLLKKVLDKEGEYSVSSPCSQLTESENSLKIVDINSSEDNRNSRFSNRFTSSENNILVTKVSGSIEGISKLKVDINKIVPELELNETRPLNLPVNRNNLENCLSPYLKSKISKKLKRNMKDAAEVESKRQKTADDSIAVNNNVHITVNNNVHITVNSLLEDNLQKKQPLESKSLNDNSKVFLSKTNSCSTSDFSSCNKSDDENSIFSYLNLKKSTPKNTYLRKLVPEQNVSPVNTSHKILQIDHNYNIEKEKNAGPVDSNKKILQVDHNCNIENKIPKVDKISLDNFKRDEINMSKGIEIKDQQILPVNGSLKVVFKSLFGEVSDTSEAEEEIFKKRRRKSKENRKSQSETNNVAQSVEINHESTNKTDLLQTAKSDKLKLNDLNASSLKSTVIENNEEINSNKTEMSRIESLGTNKYTEIFSLDTNVESVTLSKNIMTISNVQNDKQNEISSDKVKNISKQDDKRDKSHGSKKSNSSIADKNISKSINELKKNHGSEINSSIIYIFPPNEISSDKYKNNLKPKDKLEKSPISKESNSNIINNSISKPIDEFKKNSGSEETNSYITDNFSLNKISSDKVKNISKQEDKFKKSHDSKESNSSIADQNITKHIHQLEKNNNSEETNSYITGNFSSNEISSDKVNNNLKQTDTLEKNYDSEELNSNLADKNVSKHDELEKNHGSEITNSLITDNFSPNEISSNKDKNNLKRKDKLEKSPVNKESNSNILNNSIPKHIDEIQKNGSSEDTNSYITDNFSLKDQTMPECFQTDDQMDLEGGDFEFISSINSNGNVNEYSDDDYNNDLDFDIEYHKNIEYSSNVELIEHHKNPSNENLKNVIDGKSHIAEKLMYTKENSEVNGNTHNLNKLPSFYNEDVTNYVNKEIIIDDDDEEIFILDEPGPVSKAENKKSNFKVGMEIKSETVINLDSDEEDINIIAEITIEETSYELNKEFIDSKESITNNSNCNSEGASKICQSTELNDNSLEINHKKENSELNEIILSIPEFGLESTNRKSESTMTLMYHAENGSSTKVTLEANKKSVSPDVQVKNSVCINLDSNQETATTNTFVNGLINDTLKSSLDPNEISTPPNTLENILNSEESPSALIADDLEDILDINRRSVSPNALVIDETAGNDDSNSSIINKSNSDKNTSSVDELESKSTLTFTGNVNYDLNNPSILKEFNLAREIIAPEEVKSEPVASVDNNVEQEICANLLEEIKNNTCNLQVQSPSEIPVTEVSEVLNNQAASDNIPSSSIVIEISVENPEKLENGYNLLEDINVAVDNEVDDLNKKELKTTGIFKCRDINELLENPVNKQTGTSNLKVQITIPSEIPSSSTTNFSNSSINTAQVPNNISTNQINQLNNLINGDNLIQTNASKPVFNVSKPIDQIHQMVNQLPAPPMCISQQVQQPILNAVNFTITSQHASQMSNLNTAHPNPNLSQVNMQTVNRTSINAPNQTVAQFIYASSMYPNMCNLSERQVHTLNANIPAVVPNEPDTIFTLPLASPQDLILPRPFSITPLESKTSIYNKVNKWRRIILNKIETELNYIRAIPEINQSTYIEALLLKKTLTKEVWNYQLSIFNLMKCLHAIANTTSNKNHITLLPAICNSLMASEIPQMKGSMHFCSVYTINCFLKDCGYVFKDTKECINPVPLELQEYEYLNSLEQTSNLMSEKQKQQVFEQVWIYAQLCMIHREQVKSANLNYNVESQIINTNKTVPSRPVSVASISNSSTNHNSLQKSSLNDTKKKQSILNTSNVPIRKNVEKIQKNNTEISITAVGTEKRDANTKSILDNLNPTCFKCEKPSEIVCSNCLSVGYCSRECQHNHWKEIHHKTCEKHHKGI